MGLTVREVRDRIANGITTALGSAGWSESRYAADAPGMDSREILHLAFQVRVPTTNAAPQDRQSTRGGATSRATVATSVVVVQWTHRLRADAQADDYSEALGAEAELTRTLLAIDRDRDLALRIVGIRRSVPPEADLFTGEVELEVLHRLPLE